MDAAQVLKSQTFRTTYMSNEYTIPVKGHSLHIQSALLSSASNDITRCRANQHHLRALIEHTLMA